MVYAERVGRQDRHEHDLTMTDTHRGRADAVRRPGPRRLPLRRHHLGRPAAGARPGHRHPAQLLPSIPALPRAGLYELKESPTATSALGPTLVGTFVSFVVAYAAVAWLLKFVGGHSITWFVPYRLVLGFGLLGLLAAGVITAT